MRVKADYSDYAPTKWAVYRLDLESHGIQRIVPEALYVAVHPKGDRLAAVKLTGGQRDLYVFDLQGKEIARLTSDPADDAAPSWSPDEKQIAFNSKRDGKLEIYPIPAEGGDAIRLTRSEGASAYNPVWSPDGSGDANLTSDEWNNVFPGWTPDGRVIYSRSLDEGPMVTFTVRTDGSGKEPLRAIESYYARVSPDGSKIACLREQEGSIYIHSSDGKLLGTIGLDDVR